MKRAFTLIELVVVIAIVGILAAILFPIFAHPTHDPNKAMGIGCLSNTKQFGLGVIMYAQDYDEHLPPAEKWMTVSMPYIKNRPVFLCPSVKKENPKAPASYAMDSRLSGITFKKLGTPEKRALAYDSTRTDWDATDPGQSFIARHNHDKVGTLLYADGHAKWVTPETFAQAATPSP